MLRLQQCLKERARESVQSMLYLSNRVKDVIETLQLTFGRPDSIVKGIIRRTKEMPCVSEEKLETLMDYPNAVRNLAASMESLKRIGHLSNP